MLALLVFVLFVPFAHAQSCAPMLSGGSGFNDIHYINVNSSGTPYDSVIPLAMSTWNNACGGMAGSTYPEFSSGGATSVVRINYVNGPGPNGPCGAGVYCSATYDRDTSTITLYETYGDPNNPGHLADTSGSSLVNLVAHELGHVLGIDDDYCSNGLMNQQIPENPTITSEECTTADQATHVMYEGTSRQGCADLMDCHMSPILIDLDGHGIHLTGIDDGVSFDLNGDGTPERTSWTTAGSNVAFLALDLNGKGMIDNGNELFGALYGANGFLQLAAWDHAWVSEVRYGGNDNGRIDPGDAVWPRLRLWIDANHDGISQPQEIFTLDQKGVTSISLDFKVSNRRDGHGNLFRYTGSATVNGKERKAIDVFFTVDPNQ